jgi:hypothetical protein
MAMVVGSDGGCDVDAVGVEGACRGLDRYGSGGGGDVGGRWVQRVRAEGACRGLIWCGGSAGGMTRGGGLPSEVPAAIVMPSCRNDMDVTGSPQLICCTAL